MVYKGKVHVLALCRDCKWECEEDEEAHKLARRHSKKYGHEVVCEITTQYLYGEKKKVNYNENNM